MNRLNEVFARSKSENRAALIGYIPAGFPTKELSIQLAIAMVEGGVDIVEVGFPYSDPVMDGPVIQQAAEISLRNKTGARDVLETVLQINAPTLVMSYWNPIERFGAENFASELSKAGGVGVITPDLTIEESTAWISTTTQHGLHRVYVVAPSTSNDRLVDVTKACSGFVYAASLMGVTGARNSVSDSASNLVSRIRKITKLPVAVGLGVSTAEQANQVASFADGVIVGSAFIKIVLESQSDQAALDGVKILAAQLAEGVHRA